MLVMCDGVENERWDGANVGNRLERLETLSLGRQEEEEDEDNGEVSAAQGGDTAMGESAALDAEESPRASDKRSAVGASAISSSVSHTLEGMRETTLPPSQPAIFHINPFTRNPNANNPQPADDDDDPDPAGPPRRATKRSRVGALFQRTFSRAGRHRAATTPMLPADDTSVFGAPTPAADNSSFARPFSPLGRSFSPFGLLSRVGGSAAPSMVASRTIKLCLVGDVAAGKSAFLK